MEERGARARGQPAPPGVVWETLTDPHREGARRWLVLADGEVQPEIIETVRHEFVVWSSLWPERPNDVIRFSIRPDGEGSLLRWSLHTPDPLPDPGLLGRMRYRINFLINGQMRYSFGQ
jgi:hypothetical protein